MTDGVLTAEARLEQLIETWRMIANDYERRGVEVGKRAVLRACADQVEEELSRWRSAHGSRETPLDIAVIDERLKEVAAMHQDSGGSTTNLGCYWEGYGEGLKYAKNLALTDTKPAHGSEQEGPT